MSLQALSPNQSVILTSTTSSQTTTVPVGGGETLTVYNAGANPVYLKWGASVAIPATGTWTSGLIVAAPTTTQSFGNNVAGGALSYIAATAGGTLILTVGEGV